MKIKCTHGYFEFEEQRIGEVSDFMSTFGLDIVFKGGKYVFNDLSDAPDYSIKGNPYLDATALVTCEGEPWEVMERNGLVYHFANGLVVPIISVTIAITLDIVGNYFFSNGLIVPGSVVSEGQRVRDYSAWYSFDTSRFRYSEVGFV